MVSFRKPSHLIEWEEEPDDEIEESVDGVGETTDENMEMLHQSEPPKEIRRRSREDYDIDLSASADETSVATTHMRSLADKPKHMVKQDEKKRTKATQEGLLSLPPGLRKRIYRYVLLADHALKVSKWHNFRVPSILQTCRQIRNEAAAIFYTRNTFNIQMRNHKGDDLLRWLQMDLPGALSRRNVQVRTRLSMFGSTNWKNMMEWLKICHKKGLTEDVCELLESEEDYIGRLGQRRQDMLRRTSYAATTVHELREEGWRKVEQQLNRMRSQTNP